MNATCERCRDDLPLFVAGCLDADLAAALARHLATCAACRELEADWRALRDAVTVESAAAMAPVPVPETARAARPVIVAGGATSGAARRLRDALGVRLPGALPELRLAGAVALALLVLSAPLWLAGSRGGGARDRLAAPRSPVAMERAADSRDVAVTRATPVSRRATVVARVPRPSAMASAPAPASAPSIGSLDRFAGPSPSALGPTGAPPGEAVPRSSAPAPASTAAPLRPTPTSGENVPGDTPRPPSREPAAPPTASPDASPTPGATAQPTLVATGIVSGRVFGRDGTGRAEIEVRAYPADRAHVPLPMATTDVSGAFTLTVPSGAWLIGVEGAAFQPQWHSGRVEPFTADPVAVAPGAVVAGVDFGVVAHPPGSVSGRVTDADGAPIARALVTGVHLDDPADPAAPGERVGVAFTGVDGRYSLYLPPGVYALSVHRDWRARADLWWDGKATLPTCDLLGVRVDTDVEGIDFALW